MKNRNLSEHKLWKSTVLLLKETYPGDNIALFNIKHMFKNQNGFFKVCSSVFQRNQQMSTMLPSIHSLFPWEFAWISWRIDSYKCLLGVRDWRGTRYEAFPQNKSLKRALQPSCITNFSDVAFYFHGKNISQIL